MYVPRELSEETAARIGGLQPWLTNEYEHDGLRADGARVLDRLISLARLVHADARVEPPVHDVDQDVRDDDERRCDDDRPDHHG